jgi:hypothetical protein
MIEPKIQIDDYVLMAFRNESTSAPATVSAVSPDLGGQSTPLLQPAPQEFRDGLRPADPCRCGACGAAFF